MLVVVFADELVKANVMVAWEVVTPAHRMRPVIIAVPVRCRTDVELTVLSSMLALTPGTLPLDLDREASLLYLHALHAPSPARLQARVRSLEDRLLAVLR